MCQVGRLSSVPKVKQKAGKQPDVCTHGGAAASPFLNVPGGCGEAQQRCDVCCWKASSYLSFATGAISDSRAAASPVRREGSGLPGSALFLHSRGAWRTLLLLHTPSVFLPSVLGAFVCLQSVDLRGSWQPAERSQQPVLWQRSSPCSHGGEGIAGAICRGGLFAGRRSSPTGDLCWKEAAQPLLSLAAKQTLSLSCRPPHTLPSLCG